VVTDWGGGHAQGVLAEVRPREYPKDIATQNLWLSREGGMRNGKVIDEVEIAKALDADDIDFQCSLTAKIWCQLESGKEFYEMDVAVNPRLLSDYLADHNVQKLKAILRD
jgi:hypothetical protein